MSKSSWGKPSIFLKDLEAADAKWFKIPTPAEDTTTLEGTKGDKLEANIEGGEPEDVKYNKNKYVFNYSIRALEGREMPVQHDEGVVLHQYAVALQPENPASLGFMIDKSAISVLDGYTPDGGVVWQYSHDVLVPDSGKKVKWGVISVTGDNEAGYTISGTGADFTE